MKRESIHSVVRRPHPLRVRRDALGRVRAGCTRHAAGQAGRGAGGAADRPSVEDEVDVQLRRRLGHVRVRELALRQSKGARGRRGLERPVVRGLREARAVGSYTLASSSEVYGKISAVGERTYGSVPADFGLDISSFGAEDLSIGWRSGNAFEGLGENALDFVVGRTQYQLGHGFLLFDGAAEGGSRGGYWTNARKAFELAAIGRFKPGAHTVEAFYLDKDELEENDTGSRLWGANYEYAIGEHTTLGATYMKWFADAALEPGRDGLNVFNVRAYTAPLRGIPDLSFEFEYASERNGEALDSNAWTAQGSYELSDVSWTPTFTYRYAFFQGDDPGTTNNEAFDPLFPGFHDWGYWWQGEIAGGYFLSNSNLKSHLVRAQVTPNDAVGGGLLFYKFSLDQPQAIVPGVTEVKQGRRAGDRRLCRLEGELELHGQPRWRFRRSGEGGPAIDRSDQELRLRDGLRGLQLLSGLICSV